MDEIIDCSKELFLITKDLRVSDIHGDAYHLQNRYNSLIEKFKVIF